MLLLLRRDLRQTCYGVLHCSLPSASASSPEELEDVSARDTAKLTVPPDDKSYEEYDAVVVRGVCY